MGSEAARRITVAFLLALLSGCASLYFDDAGSPPQPTPRFELPSLPFDEYWTGLVFNGNKIGFTHLSVEPGDEPDGFLLRSQAAMHFRFLAVDKKVALRSEDWIGPDLQLRRFRYEYHIDGNRLALSGVRHANELVVRIESRDDTREQRLSPSQALYPSSVIALYPVVNGLELGRSYRYQVYDGETQRLSEVTQEVLAYESSELFEGNAFKVRTHLLGHSVDTWLDHDGRPLLEISASGILISGLESEARAKRYLAIAALNKDEVLLDFARVPSTQRIENPRAVASLRVGLEGLDGLDVPSDGLQVCQREGSEVLCRVSRDPRRDVPPSYAGGSGDRQRYLAATLPVPSRHPEIRRLSREATRGHSSREDQIAALVAWVQQNVEQKPVDVFSAIDVLETREAECQGNTFLYAAFARSLGVPTRVVNGLVYSDELDGFLYHTWAESEVGGRWQAVDPTFGQVRADATHIKLVEGETMAELAPILSVIGRVKARVVEVDYAPMPR